MDDEESDGVTSSKPAAKKTKITGKEAPRKISKSMKPASPPKATVKPKPKVSAVSDSDDDMIEYAVPKKMVPARTARAAPQKYIEIGSEESGGDGSMFEDD